MSFRDPYTGHQLRYKTGPEDRLPTDQPIYDAGYWTGVTEAVAAIVIGFVLAAVLRWWL